MITKEIETKQFIRRFLACGNAPIVDENNSAKQTPTKRQRNTQTHSHMLIFLSDLEEIL